MESLEEVFQLLFYPLSHLSITQSLHVFYLVLFCDHDVLTVLGELLYLKLAELVFLVSEIKI